jgi:hypothetical protein
MGHSVPTLIGVTQTGLAKKITKLIPDYMAMSERGMADMAEMTMPIPDNTAPMMTGEGPFGGVEMGGMFSVVKVRAEQKAGDYSDPGWYKHPKGEVAYEWTGSLPDPARFAADKPPVATSTPMVPNTPSKTEMEVKVRKPMNMKH